MTIWNKTFYRKTDDVVWRKPHKTKLEEMKRTLIAMAGSIKHGEPHNPSQIWTQFNAIPIKLPMVFLVLKLNDPKVNFKEEISRDNQDF